MNNICALVPAYNEEKAIGSLVRGLLSKVETVIVVDDGSIDKTSSLAEEAGAVVLRHKSCLGKGAALQTGYKYCLEKGYEAVLNLDGDGQHDWREADKFIDKFKEEEAGIIIGNRMGEVKNMPKIRLLTNYFTSKIVSFLSRQEIKDSQCGYRLIKKEVLEKIKLSTSHYDTESELLIKAGQLEFKIVSIPIQTIYRGEESKINRLVDTWRFIRLIFKSFSWIKQKR